MKTVKAAILAALSFIVLIWAGTYSFHNVEDWAKMPVVMTCFIFVVIIFILLTNIEYKGDE